MAKWRKNGAHVIPNFNIKCLGCGDPDATFSHIGYALSNFPLNNDRPEDYNSYVIDMTFHCDLCGWRTVFGVAISKEHFKEIIAYDLRENRGYQNSLRFCKL